MTNRKPVAVMMPDNDSAVNGSVAPELAVRDTQPQSGSLSPFLRKVIVAAMLSFAILVLSLSLKSTGNAAHKDFISYWAAGHLFLHHQNPYDPAVVMALEKSVGFTLVEPMFMRNPPHALLLALPIAFLDPSIGAVVWSLLIVASVVASIRLLWRLHGSPPGSLHLLGYLFAPVLACLTLGQTSTFILLALAFFLTLRDQRPLLAGLLLCLLTIKPHLFLVFGVTLIAWVLAEKRYRIFCGFLGGIAGCLVVSVTFLRSAWFNYWAVLSAAHQESRFMPTSSATVWATIGHGINWTQFAPAVLGCLWALFYFWRNRAKWNWETNGSAALLLSILVAPYSWFTDEVLVLPALFNGFYHGRNSDRSLLFFGILNGIALLAVVAGVPVGSGFYRWTPLTWLAWCSYSASVRSSP